MCSAPDDVKSTFAYGLCDVLDDEVEASISSCVVIELVTSDLRDVAEE